MQMIEVAAGVVRRADGRVLICAEPDGWKGCGSFRAANSKRTKPPPSVWNAS